MQVQRTSLRPVFFAGWACLASVAFWRLHAGASDSTLAITAGGVLLVSLAASRHLLGLSFMSGPMLYLILLGLFHLGLVVPWALGAYDISRIPSFVPYGLGKALALITYSILAYQLGLFVAVGSLRRRTSLSTRIGAELENHKVFSVGTLIFVVGFLMFVVGMIQLDPVGFYRLTYFESFRLRAESDPRFFGAGMMFASIGLSIAVAGASKEQIRGALWATGAWVSSLFYLGFRGPALITALVVCTITLKKEVKFPNWFPWLASAILLMAIPLVRIIREEPLNERLSGMPVQSFSILDAPAEMGGGIRPLVKTQALIGADNYRYGSTYLLGIKGIIPNLSLRWEASSTESADDMPPAQWITAAVDPWAYKNYGGIGFSAIAEPYMNFGTLGVIVYFVALAFLLVWLEQISIRDSFTLACWALVLGPLLWTTRNDFCNFFRPVVWGLLCLGAVRFFSRDTRSSCKTGSRL